MLHFGDWQPFPLTLTHRSTNDFVQYFIQTCKQIKIHFNYQVKTLPNHNLVFPSVFFFRLYSISEFSLRFSEVFVFQRHLWHTKKIETFSHHHIFVTHSDVTFHPLQKFISSIYFHQIKVVRTLVMNHLLMILCFNRYTCIKFFTEFHSNTFKIHALPLM